ncbi:MAG: phosphonate transport system substrate-binding protein, partial [Oleispira sp.]
MKKQFVTWATAFSLLMTGLTATTVHAEALSSKPTDANKPTFVFTAIPDADESRLQQRFNKVAVYLSEKLNVPVQYIPVKSYAAAVTAFRNDQVQLAWF